MTTTTNHPKPDRHAGTKRPASGFFGRNELGILGTNCGNIKQLAYQLIRRLPAYHVAYVDADHKSADQEKQTGKDPHTALAHGASLECTDKITFQRLDYGTPLHSWEYRSAFNATDLVLINGNHFTGTAQIVVVDPAKSLEKKLDKLTNVRLVLLADGVTDIPAYLQPHLPADAPVLRQSDTDAVVEWVSGWMRTRQPALKGLVLAGGLSTRMQRDKGQLNYHGKSQREYAGDLLAPFCQEVYLSCRPDQVAGLPSHFSAIPDSFLGLGPLGGILSAFRHDPDAAWLVVACDLPYLNQATLDYLVTHRNPSRMATAFKGTENDMPEPLITIWEPKSYPVLLQALGMGFSCPRKTLMNSPVHLLDAPDQKALTNVNHPAEYEAALRELAADTRAD